MHISKAISLLLSACVNVHVSAAVKILASKFLLLMEVFKHWRPWRGSLFGTPYTKSPPAEHWWEAC